MKTKNLFITSISLAMLVNGSLALAKEEHSNAKVAVLPATTIFKPLIADPKWPRFSLGYQNHSKGSYGRHVFAPNFGAVLPMVRDGDISTATYELSVHAGLFAIMDMSSDPTRLINADYFVGPAFAMKNGNLESLVRISHTSSHLGDEFMLSKQGRGVKRINLSYETVETIVAYNCENGLRPYGGLGYIVHADPKKYKTAELTLGVDYRSPNTIMDGFAKTIMGVHSKTSENYKWRPSISAKAGLEFEDKIFIGKALQVLVEYYNGNSVNGQFYKNREQYVGTSLNIHF